MSSITDASSLPLGSHPRPGFAAPGWLSGQDFDLRFVAGTSALALATAAALAIDGGLFKLLLVLDLWCLGYHHVIATFTRMALDSDSSSRHRWLLTWAPLGVLGVVVALALNLGAWAIVTIYLYWQWWHYTRQSYGVAQLYRLKSGVEPLSLREMQAAIYLLPLTGILYRSWQDPDEFLGAEVWTVPVPGAVLGLAAAITVAALTYTGWRMWRSWRAGQLAPAFALYLLSHLAIFGVGYFAFESIDYGWLVINVWHNAQYLLIVWLFNNRSFKNQVDPEHWLASTLSSRRNVGLYFGLTFAASLALYLALSGAISLLSLSVTPVAVVVYQTINFHHYLVDGVIWKVRRPQVGAKFGLAPQQQG